ncbi:hypothetical protein Tco_1144657 [Tanacetum coccineum]
MDSIIPLGQKNTLVEYMILSGVDNRPPMLDKDLYDSWKKNRVIRTKKYAELSTTEKIQADCDMKATNIILQDLPADIYSLVNHHRVAKDLWERGQLLMQGCSKIIMENVNHDDEVPVVEPNQHNDVPVVPEPVLEDEDEDNEDEEFEEDDR